MTERGDDRGDRRDDAVWTEDELDAALAGLHSTARTTDTMLATARKRVLAEVIEQPARGTGQRRRSRRRWLLSAAAVLLVVVATVAGVVLFQSATAGPASAQAVAVLDKTAAGTIGSSDPVVAAGQYRYVVTRAWNVRGIGSPSSGPMSYLAETVIEVWAPQDYRQEWMQERATTGRKKWLQGDERQAREANLLVDYPSDQAGKSAVLRAQCGDFGAVDTGKQPCTTPGSWQAPTPEFVAGLPRDPQQLHERLLRDAPGERRGDARALVYAADALRSGLLPADVRSALYQALTRLRGLEVTDGAANLDGRTGTALGIDDGERRQDIIVDPATGTFIGERQVLTGDDSDTDLPEGTVTSFTSVQTTVVQTLGERPPR